MQEQEKQVTPEEAAEQLADAFVDEIVEEALETQEIHEDPEPDDDAQPKMTLADITGAKLKISTYNSKEDHRAFYIFGMTRKYPLLSVGFLVAEAALSFWFSFSGKSFSVGQVILYFCLFLLADAAYILLRARNLLRNMEKRNSLSLQTVRLDLAFMQEEIILLKKGVDRHIPYSSLQKVRESSNRIFLYFAQSKALLIRKDDLDKEQLKAVRDIVAEQLPSKKTK